MFTRLKKLVGLALLAASIGAGALPASNAANALPKAPAVEAAAPVKVGYLKRRRGRRIRSLRLNCRFRHCTPNWRQCQHYWNLWVRTGNRYWNYRYRRCRKMGWLTTP